MMAHHKSVKISPFTNSIYEVVNIYLGGVYMFWFKFILGLNFIFLLFLGVVMYDNEFETMENKHIQYCRVSY